MADYYPLAAKVQQQDLRGKVAVITYGSPTFIVSTISAHDFVDTIIF